MSQTQLTEHHSLWPWVLLWTGRYSQFRILDPYMDYSLKSWTQWSIWVPSKSGCSVIAIYWLCSYKEWTQKSTNHWPTLSVNCVPHIAHKTGLIFCFYHQQPSHLSLSSTALPWWHWGFQLCMGWARLAFAGTERPSKPGKLVWRWERTAYIFLSNQDNKDLPCCAAFWTRGTSSLLRCCYAHIYALLEQKLLHFGFFFQSLMLLTARGWHAGARVDWLSLVRHTNSALTCSFPLPNPPTYTALLLMGAKQQRWSSCEIQLPSICSPARLHTFNLAI